MSWIGIGIGLFRIGGNDTMTGAQILTALIADGQAVSTATPSTLAYRDSNGDFSARVITHIYSGLGTSTASGMILSNATAAANNAQQISPAAEWSGFGWKTNSTAASQQVQHRAVMLPVQGAANPYGELRFLEAINGGAFAQYASFSGTTNSGNTKGTLLIGGTGGCGMMADGGSELTMLAANGAQNTALKSGGATPQMMFWANHTVAWTSGNNDGGNLSGKTQDTIISRAAAGVVLFNGTIQGTFPTSNPGVVGRVWSNLGILTVSAG